MERKKQFQIQSLNSKLTTYETTLKELLLKRECILASALLTDTQTQTNTNFTIKINYLLSSKLDIATQITNTKKQITSCKYDINNITNKIKLLPCNLSQNIENETSIYNDEITNINNIITDTNNQYQANLYNANLEKQSLFVNINAIQQQIQQQTDTITELQTNAHNSRKTVLQELHQKKIQKKQIQQQIENISNQSTIYNQHLERLSEINTILAQLKLEIINSYYTNTNHNDDLHNDDLHNDDLHNDDLYNDDLHNELIMNLINKLNDNTLSDISDVSDVAILDNPISTLQIEKLKQPEYINYIIAEIDNTIANNSARINIIGLKAEKAKVKNDTHIENIKKHSTNTARNKVISYKDQYKMEKGQRTALQNKLEEMQYLYDNYDVIVINKIVDEYNNALLELNNHKIRTVERLNIMKERLTLEYKENNNNLEEEILSIQDKLTTHNKTLEYLKTQINSVVDNLTELDKSNLELHNLDNNINQLETTITKIKNDKTILEGL